MEKHLDLLYRGISRPGGWHDFADYLCVTLDCEDVVISLDAKPHRDIWWFDGSGYEVILNVALSPACVMKLILRRATFKPVFDEGEMSFLKELGPHLARAFRLGLENTAVPVRWLAISRFLSELHIAMVCRVGGTKYVNEYASYIFDLIGDKPGPFLSRMQSIQEPVQIRLDGIGIIEFSAFQDDEASGFVGYEMLPRIEDKLMESYRLTKTEKYVARLLAEGFSLDVIVDITRRSKETTRTHSKNIYKKLSVKGQVELVSLVNRIQRGLKRRG